MRRQFIVIWETLLHKDQSGAMMKIIDAEKSNSQTARRGGGVIVPHGHLAAEFLAGAEMILGPIHHITTASIDWHADVDVARRELDGGVRRLTQGRRIRLTTG